MCSLVSTCYVAHETSQGVFLRVRDHGSLSPMIKVALLKCSPPSPVLTSRRSKALIKLVFVIGCHCIITRECIGSHTVISQSNCDKERLGYLRNLGSLSRDQI